MLPLLGVKLIDKCEIWKVMIDENLLSKTSQATSKRLIIRMCIIWVKVGKRAENRCFRHAGYWSSLEFHTWNSAKCGCKWPSKQNKSLIFELISLLSWLVVYNNVVKNAWIHWHCYRNSLQYDSPTCEILWSGCISQLMITENRLQMTHWQK